MLKTILTRKKELLAFTVGLGAAVLSTSALTASATVSTSGGADINVVSHAHGCIKISGSGGTINVFQNGIKNTGTSALRMACALTSPADGFDTAADAVGADFNDANNDTGTAGAVIFKNCYTNRSIAGTGCSTGADSSALSGGLYTGIVAIDESLNTTGNTAAEAGAPRYLDITLPKVDGTSASVLRAFGYKDASLADISSDIDAFNTLLSQISGTGTLVLNGDNDLTNFSGTGP